jgi:beta-glucosidase
VKKSIIIFLCCSSIWGTVLANAPDRTALHESTKQQAAKLVAQMTLEEKFKLTEMNNRAIDRFKIPSHHWWNEALHGVARRGKATQFPIALSMASTWDPALIQDMATAISDEARALHAADTAQQKTARYHGLTLWSPVINMARDPRWGRTEETYGEDPHLTTELACGFVHGLQGDDPNYLKTVATIKHFVANNTEHNRLEVRPDISDRALRDYYFPAYRDTIAREDVESVMSAYNGINGIPCSANRWLLTDLLRGEWGFNGTVVTDVGAPGHLTKYQKYSKDSAEATAMMLNAGVDIFSKGLGFPALKQALEQGLLDESVLDEAVTRSLATRIKLGLLRSDADNPYQKISMSVVGSAAHLKIARQVAREGAVLLKNDKQLLPATPAKYKRIILAGPDMNKAPLGGYSGTATQMAATPMLGLKSIAGDDFEVLGHFASNWQPIPSGNLNLPGQLAAKGVQAAYYAQKFSDKPMTVRIDSTVYLDLPKEYAHIDPEIPAQPFCTRWTAELTPNRTGEHRFSMSILGGAVVWVNGEKIIDRWTLPQGRKGQKFVERIESEPVFLQAGQPVDLKVEYSSHHGAITAALQWLQPPTDNQTVNPTEDLLVYVGGLSHEMAHESKDLMDLNLPSDQFEEIKELAQSYPNLVVVLNGGTVMQLDALRQVVPAILLQWFPGQEGGYALAELLTGVCNPSGRLPLSFYTDASKLPDFEDYEISKGRTYMYARDNVTYPFGYGLSYTSFEYSNLRLRQVDEVVTATLDVCNIGPMDGDEVVQLYVSNLDSKVYQPIRQLKAFQRVSIPRGQTKTLELSFELSDLAWWDEVKQAYVINPGRYAVQLGQSSATIHLQQIMSLSASDVSAWK